MATITGNANFPSDTGTAVEGARSFMLGDPNGATVKLQVYHADIAEWVDLPSGSFTAATFKNLFFNTKVMVRVNCTSYASNIPYFF